MWLNNVNEPAMQYLKQTPQHGGSSQEIKTATDCHINISLPWKLSNNITFQYLQINSAWNGVLVLTAQETY
jgi:hypothetical protein